MRLPSEASEQKAVDLGRARPFSVLQQRLGRKKVSDKMLREIPVAFLAFDVLYAGGELVMDRPLRERARILDALLAAERKVTHHRGTETQRKTQTREIWSFEPELKTRISRAASVIRAPVFRVVIGRGIGRAFCGRAGARQ